MAYPMVPMPSLGEFLAKLSGHGVVVLEAKNHAMGPKGEETYRYLRNSNGAIVILPKIEDGDVLSPTVVSAWCRELGVSCQDEFGFDLTVAD